MSEKQKSPDREIRDGIRAALARLHYFYAEFPEVNDGVPYVVIRANPMDEYQSAVVDGKETFVKRMSFGAAASLQAGGHSIAEARLGVLLAVIEYARTSGFQP